MKNIIVLSAIVFLNIHIQAQTTTTYPQIKRSTDWILYQEVSGVKQYYKFQECNIPEEGYFRESVLLKLENTTDEIKQVDWDMVMWYGSNCINCDTDIEENHRKVTLQPNSSLESTCSLSSEESTLKIFSKFLNYSFDDWVLTHFELRNFSVK